MNQFLQSHQAKASFLKFLEVEIPFASNYLFLRGFLDSNCSTDIDILVSSGFATAVANRLGISCTKYGFKLFAIKDQGFVVNLLFFLGFDGDNPIFQKVDLGNGLNWRNLGTNDVFGDILLTDNIKFSSKQKSCLASYIQKLLYSGSFSLKDKQRITRIMSPSDLKANLDSLMFPCNPENQLFDNLNVFNKFRLRFKSYCSGSSKLKLPTFLIETFFSTLKSYFRTNGSSFYFSGIDGSGKSTVIDILIKSLRVSGIHDIRVIHFLPSVVPPIHILLKRKKTTELYTKPYSETQVSSNIINRARYTYYIFAFLLSKLYCQALVRCGLFLFFDRSIIDFYVDPARIKTSVRVPMPLVKKLLLKAPYFVFNPTPLTAVQRKGELSLDKASELHEKYLRASHQLDAKLINSDISVQQCIHKVINEVHTWNLRFKI